MKLCRAILALVALLVFTAAPVLACAVSSDQMNADEMACCKKMAGDCGAMKNSDHSCCKATLVVNEETHISIAPSLAPPVQLMLIAQAAFAVPHSHIKDQAVMRLAHSPPPPPGSSITVLRI